MSPGEISILVALIALLGKAFIPFKSSKPNNPGNSKVLAEKLDNIGEKLDSMHQLLTSCAAVLYELRGRK